MHEPEHSAAGDLDDRRPSLARRVLLLLTSLITAALLLMVVRRLGPIELWPASVSLPEPWLYVTACVLHVPFTLARSQRLRFLLDPLVRRASDRRDRVDWRVLHGSGMLSFPIVMLLPFRLGELARPVLLVRADEPGVGFAESLSAIAAERLLDGLIVVGMLLLGLGFATFPSGARADGEVLAYLRGFGRLMVLAFVLGLGGLLLAATRPAAVERIVARVIPGRLGRRVGESGRRAAETVAVLLDWRCGLPLLASSLIYWGVGVGQLWLVLHACGLDLGLIEAVAIVAIVALAIQLPGGPAQTGSFQLGMATALSLLTAPADQAAASSFAALMYLVELVGPWVLALPGVWLLAWARRSPAR